MTASVKSVADPSPADAIFRPENWTDPLPLDRMYAKAQPVEVDVGCGKGTFLLASARAHPEINYLGIDRMLRRLRKVNRKVARERLSNVRLVRVEASYAIRYLLPADALSAAYIFFPDPWPKRRHHKRRLFTLSFLDALHKSLRSGGLAHVATDHEEYAEAIHELFRADPRFEEIPVPASLNELKTDFEKTFLQMNLPIWKRSFRKKTDTAVCDGGSRANALGPVAQASKPAS